MNNNYENYTNIDVYMYILYDLVNQSCFCGCILSKGDKMFYTMSFLCAINSRLWKQKKGHLKQKFLEKVLVLVQIQTQVVSLAR